MATTVLVNLNLAGNQVLGLRLEVLAANPRRRALLGPLWFNSSTSQVKYYDGSAVQVVGSGAAGVTSLTVDGTTIENIGTGRPRRSGSKTRASPTPR